MGQPNIFDRILRYTEYIGVSRNTQGTETSHYLQEEKENSIPLVAASETGKAQTKELALWGCRTPLWERIRIVEEPGKVRQRG